MMQLPEYQRNLSQLGFGVSQQVAALSWQLYVIPRQAAGQIVHMH